MSARLLEPTAVAQLASLALRARTVAEGALAGLHRSAHHGAAVEFAEHKEYSPGDELRHIDWKAYGRFDRYYVKRYETENELRGWLLVDSSASMGYAGAGPSKLAYATWLAAGLAWLLLRQRDQAGLVAFDEEPRAVVPPRGRPGHLAALLDALEGLAPSGKTQLARAIDYVSGAAHRRSLIVVFSDLLDDEPAEAVALLRGLRARRHDVALFHLLDGDELRLPFDAPTRFEGMEDRAELMVDPRAVRAAYQAAVERFVGALRRGCADGDVTYQLVDTARPPSEALLAFLQARTGRR